MTPEERAQQVLEANNPGPDATAEATTQSLEQALRQLAELLEETQEC